MLGLNLELGLQGIVLVGKGHHNQSASHTISVSGCYQLAGGYSPLNCVSEYCFGDACAFW
jgi:hypothetical protein